MVWANHEKISERTETRNILRRNDWSALFSATRSYWLGPPHCASGKTFVGSCLQACFRPAAVRTSAVWKLQSWTHSSSVAANTRRLHQLTTVHPFPIQQVGVNIGNSEFAASCRGFAFIVCRIWNELNLQAHNIDSLTHFITFLDSVDWKHSKPMHFLFSKLSDFFCVPGTATHTAA